MRERALTSQILWISGSVWEPRDRRSTGDLERAKVEERTRQWERAAYPESARAKERVADLQSLKELERAITTNRRV
jgi:hypothetical protein